MCVYVCGCVSGCGCVFVLGRGEWRAGSGSLCHNHNICRITFTIFYCPMVRLELKEH